MALMEAVHKELKMQKKLLLLSLIFFSTLTLIGCVNIPEPIPLQIPSDDKVNIGVILTEPPEAAAQYTGNIGLLDLAIISGANSALNSHLKTLTFEDYEALPAQIVEILEARGFHAQVIDQVIPRDIAKKLSSHKEGLSQNDFLPYLDNIDVDYVLLLNMSAIGTTRPYYGFLPTAPPQANTALWGELVNLGSKKVFWYKGINSLKTIPEPWDEPDQGYPNLTNAVYLSLNEVLEMVKVELGNPEAEKVSAK